MDIYRKELNDIYDAQQLDRERLDPAVLTSTNDLASAMVRLTGGCCVITDASADSSFIYAGPLGRMLGLSETDELDLAVDSSDEDIIYDLLHPEDLVYKRMLEYELFKLVDSLPSDLKTDYKATCRVRIQDSCGRYIYVENTTRVVRISPKGKLWLILCTYDLSPMQDATEGITPRIINMRNGYIRPMNFEAKKRKLLTAREKLVLQFIRQGKFSKEIADELNVSINTVSRHRQNIIAKLSVGNSFEAVDAAIRMKLI